MGVFDYLSSLFETKEDEGTTSKATGSTERTPLAPSLDPARINAQHRHDKRKKKDANANNEAQQNAASRKERRPADGTAPGKAGTAPVAGSSSANSASLKTGDQPAARESARSASAVAVAEPIAAQAQPATATLPELTPSEADVAIDAAFGSGASQSVTHVSAIARELDEAAVRELYAGIAAQHARPVKNFVAELARGTANKEWIEICRPVMATLIQGAEAMGLPSAARPMKDFDEALSLAAEGGGDGLDPAARDLLLGAWNDMREALPEAFQPGDDERRRESVIIHALLKQIPDIGTVTFERLYGAGLTTLEGLFLANKDDLAATTGIPRHLCERICDRVQEHRREVERLQKSMGLIERLERLRLLLKELRKQHEGFERAAAEEWKNPALADEKRGYRQARHLTALKLEVVLAEMGEIELVEQLQSLPFPTRIERLEEYIQQSQKDEAALRAKEQEQVPVPAGAKR